MANIKARGKSLLKSLVLLGVLYAYFRFLGGFSSQQTAVLTLMAWMGYWLYEYLNVSRKVADGFSPFRISIETKWHDLLFDFKLINTDDEYRKLWEVANKATERGNTVLRRRGFTFTVIKPPGDHGLLPGLTFWDDRKVFLAEVELYEPIIEIEDDMFGIQGGEEEHPFFHHPRWANLPIFYFKWGSEGYEIGLEVQDDWWGRLSQSKSATGPAAQLAKDWGINLVTVLTTGIPFDITNAAALSNTSGSDRPNVVCNPNSGFQQNVYEWFNTSCFTAQPLYTYGDLGRNVLHAPGREDLDLAIHREFIPREGMRLQFRAEAFNITNTTAFAAPGASFGSATFGVINSAGLGRNIQLALKLLF